MSWRSIWNGSHTAPALSCDMNSAIDRPRGGVIASIRTRIKTDADARNLALITIAFLLVVASTYTVGWIVWKAFGLSDGAPAPLIHSIYDRWDVLNYALIAKNGYGSRGHFRAWFPPLPGVIDSPSW